MDDSPRVVITLICSSCGYPTEADDRQLPCPICGGTTWDHPAWRPFSRLLAELSPARGAASAPGRPRPL
ncbi:MAG: hypothetical protein QOE36_101 [Gaiellaceae bacterium]|nr:hypothetical protein [Gaiellaceae bacterium]